MSADDTSPCDINDFTTASAWEQFVAQVEQVIRRWNLQDGGCKGGSAPLTRSQLLAAKWMQTVESLTFGRVSLLLHHFSLAASLCQTKHSDSKDTATTRSVALQDSASVEHDFLTRCPTVTRLFGLREFLLITSAEKDQPINTLDRVKLLLSSAALALANAGAVVPLFVQVDAAGHFVGLSLDSESRTDYDMICLKRVPASLRNLSGLLSLFKEKLGYSPADCPSVSVSARFAKSIRR